jgi:integrase
MATFKAEIPYLKEDGTARVIIRLTHKRMLKYINTDIYLTKDDITKAGKVKSDSIKDDIEAIVKQYRDDVRALGLKVEVMTADELKTYLIKKNSTTQDKEIDFIAYGRAKVEQLKREGRDGSAKNYNAALNSLVRFLGRETIGINEITALLMRDYERWLLATKSAKSDKLDIKVQGRGVSLYTGTFRTLINDAKEEYNDEDLGIIRVKVSPFTKYKVPKPAATRKRALDVEVIRKIRDLELGKQRRATFARDMYILSFYLVGMNSADLYGCTDYKNGRITYNRAKTKDRRADAAEISIKVEPEALELLEKYKDSTGERVFCFYRMYADEGTFNDAINKGLKQVGEKLGAEDLEFYSARHSWATIAVNDCEVDKYTVHTALNHADESMRITDIYIKKDFTIIDRANRKVLDYLNEPI